ncbi:MAG TPA: polysaccharide biosynthesis tyrosine autokinase [Anaeromyxobacteraceae bacterium]|nr:polysaccharide biosynthesis tyrosine autokinase [Anaeromyxobacteraceae bacterium]
MDQRNRIEARLEVLDHDVRRSPAPPEVELDAAEREAAGLAEAVAIVGRGWWLVAAATALAVAAGGAYALLATPVYRSDAVVQVEERSRGIAGLEELTSMFSSATPAETEIEILRSRTLLGLVVDELALDVVAEPRHLLLVGAPVARARDGRSAASAPPGLGRYGWGGERIGLERLEVAPRLLGEPLRLTALGAGRYRVEAPGGEVLVEGDVGRPVVSGADPDDPGMPSLAVFVSELRARPGTQFTVQRLARDTAVDALQLGLAVAERGRKTGVLELALEGPDPVRAARVLDAVARLYVRQNVERKSAEAEKTLEFLNGQLPQLRANLEAAEGALNAYRGKRGQVDLSLQAKAALDGAVEVERRLSELELQKAELLRRFTPDHPALRALADKIERLGRERDAAHARMRGLPEAELQSARLTRDVKVANELYVLVLNKVQELKVVKSGTIGNVRVLDAARRPRQPVKPRRGAALLLALLGGLTLGVGLAFAREALDRGVSDPAEVERAARLQVYASVPRSQRQVETERALGRAGKRKMHPVLAALDPRDLAVEAVRSLRTSVLFAMRETGTNVIAVGGPGPSIGKSFLSVNLAHVMAEAGSRVLVVDADLRKGRIHEYLGGARMPGLAEAVADGLRPEELVRATDHPNLSFLAQGRIPPNPSELLASDRLQQVLAWASRAYDVVIVDTAPILAVTDAALVSRHAGVTLLVLRAGRHPAREIALAARRYAQNGVRVHAAILNDVRQRRGGGEYHYQYDYR